MEKYKINIYKDSEEDTFCLPVVFPPPIQCYLPISIISNIVTANMNNLNWIMHNFVQLFKYADEDKVESFPVQQFMYANQASISCKEITNEIMCIERINIIEDIIHCINNKHYVVVYLDESQIPGMRFYRCKPIVHSHFIFGYNKRKGIFKIINFSSSSEQMEILDVAFSDIKRNFYSEKLRALYKNEKNEYVSNKGYQIYAFLYCDNINIIDTSLNIDVIKEQMKQYLYSVNSSIYTSYFTGTLSGTWGVNAYSEIEKMLHKRIDMRMLCLLYEHKMFMQYRINYLDSTLAEEYSKVVKLAMKIKMCCLKHIVMQQTVVSDNVIKYLRDMKELESHILENII
jgi:hypothetical protein